MIHHKHFGVEMKGIQFGMFGEMLFTRSCLLEGEICITCGCVQSLAAVTQKLKTTPEECHCEPVFWGRDEEERWEGGR